MVLNWATTLNFVWQLNRYVFASLNLVSVGGIGRVAWLEYCMFSCQCVGMCVTQVRLLLVKYFSDFEVILTLCSIILIPFSKFSE